MTGIFVKKKACAEQLHNSIALTTQVNFEHGAVSGVVINQ